MDGSAHFKTTKRRSDQIYV